MNKGCHNERGGGRPLGHRRNMSAPNAGSGDLAIGERLEGPVFIDGDG
jgi:hypothetical protein